MTSYDFGNMCMFFFKAIAMTTLMNDSNPFNQPGVEVYKKNMFKLLGKSNDENRDVSKCLRLFFIRLQIR